MTTRAKKATPDETPELPTVSDEEFIELLSAGMSVPEEFIELISAGMSVPKAEPDFEQLTRDLAAADAAARSTSADASAARANRSDVAVSAIRAAFREGINPEDVRTDLLDAGVLKGTVSKIVTVLNALNDKILGVGDVKSLNGAYSTVKAVHKVSAGTSFAATGVPFATTPSGPPVVATTPEEAMKVIVNAVKSVVDPDEAFKLAGEWITRITNQITAALKNREDEDEDENEEEDF